LVVYEWERNGVPDRGGGGCRPVSETIDVDTVLESIQKTDLTSQDAERIVSALKTRGLIETTVVKAGPGSELFTDFLSRFWDYDESPYVRDKLAHGHSIGRRHCYDMALWLKLYWRPFFGEKRLSEIQKPDLKSFSLWLAESKNLKPKTINNILSGELAHDIRQIVDKSRRGKGLGLVLLTSRVYESVSLPCRRNK